MRPSRRPASESSCSPSWARRTAWAAGPGAPGDPAERARTTVTSRVRDAIARIDAELPELGRHLRASVRTGIYCVYAPETPTTWETRPTT